MHGRKLAVALATASMMLGVVGSSAANAAEPNAFSNGFETDTAGWYDATRVPSGTDGVTSAGGGWHATDSDGNAFTDWGGYSSTFPPAGWTTSLDIYLDTNCPADDTRFDWDSAASRSNGTHLRDFVFNAGCYTSPTPHFTISAGTNAGRNNSYPANPGHDPFTIESSGWYTFKHRFYNDSGVLAVDMSIADANGNVLHTWTVSDGGDAIAGVGGNRYGWVAQDDFPSLAFDNSALTVTTVGCDDPAAIDKTSVPNKWLVTHDCFTDQTIAVPNRYTLDGQGHTITAVDPANGHFLGAVVGNETGAAWVGVTNLTVTASGLADSCDGGTDRLRGILLDGAGGSITDNTVTDVNQGHSGCQEGNAIEIRNFPEGSADRTNVTISGNTVSGYQKNGITANGQVAASVLGNTVTGAGPIDYTAQNGIQVGFGATATVKGNSASGNWYTPQSDVACGLLLYQAGGVKASSNALFANERDQCNYGKGGGNSGADA
jgi:hypothetical protein